MMPILLLLPGTHPNSRSFPRPPSLRFLLLLLLAALFPPAVLGFCPPGCLCNDSALSVLCDFAGLTAIPILLNPMLKSLAIRNSNALKLDTFSIALYPELEQLELSHNRIAQIPSGFLAPLGQLRALNLSGNRLRTIEGGIFHRLPKLERLDLSESGIERIAADAFGAMPGLVQLDLSANQIHILPPNPFAGVPTLEVLHLDSNKLAKLSARQFNGSSGLRALGLAGNILSELPSDAFQSLSRLQKLDLSSNLISIVRRNAFAGLGQLRELNLARNLLSSPSPVAAIDTAMGGSGEVTNRGRGGGREETTGAHLSQQWAHLPALERLDLSGNAWTEISENAFAGGLNSVRELRMEEMSQLREIKANGLAGLPSLERLSLASSAFLSSIDGRAFGEGGARELRHLDLSHCQLTTLDQQLLYDWAALKTLKLTDNRWNCDCALVAFLPAILRQQRKEFTDSVVCTLPEPFRDLKMVDAAEKDLSALHGSSDCGPSALAFSRRHFLWLASAALLLMLASLIPLAICLCTKSGTNRCFSCLCPCFQHKSDRKDKDQSRVQLYATGSSYTESLIYEKGPPIAAGIFPPDNPPLTQSNRLPFGHHPHPNPSLLYGFGRQLPSPRPNLYIGRQRQQTPLSSAGDWTEGVPHIIPPAANSASSTASQDSQSESAGLSPCSNAHVDAEDYYSSITGDNDRSPAEGKQKALFSATLAEHRSPPDSPPPPPPPFFASSQPSNWIASNGATSQQNLLAGMPAFCCPCPVAAPPYQLRSSASVNNWATLHGHGQQQQYGGGVRPAPSCSRPPSIVAPQPPSGNSRRAANC